MANSISVSRLSKIYEGDFQALDDVSLDVEEGEILALLGPNGAGKTTLISIICGLVSPTSGTVTVGGHDIIKDYRQARSLIGLVPQELTHAAFDVVRNTVEYSRGLFGKPADRHYIDSLLESLSLSDKADNQLMTLSGGMKRRVLIAKALSHQPRILFLDEPTAGVDVELRKDMWQTVAQLREQGVTIILTTHYIEEAEEIADRVGVINAGKLLLVEDKSTLMSKLGKKRLTIELRDRIESVPASLSEYALELDNEGRRLTYTYDTNAQRTGITRLMQDLNAAELSLCDLQTSQSTLEEIFVSLVQDTQ